MFLPLSPNRKSYLLRRNHLVASHASLALSTLSTIPAYLAMLTRRSAKLAICSMTRRGKTWRESLLVLVLGTTTPAGAKVRL